MKKFFVSVFCVSVLFCLTACTVLRVEENYEKQKEQVVQSQKETTPQKTEPTEPPKETLPPVTTDPIDFPVPPELKPLITAFFADETTQADLYYSGDNSEYTVHLAFIAEENLQFQFCSLIWETQTYAVNQILSSGFLSSGQCFVAQVSFPGDMTTYGMTVTDQNGSRQHFAISISGKDGSLICQPFEPEEVKNQYTHFLGSFCYHIPVVELPDVNVKAINELLYETHYQNLKTHALDIPECPFMLAMVYSVYQKGDIVSVMVQEDYDCDLSKYSVYHFSAATGNPLNDADVFAAFNLTPDEGTEILKNSLTLYWNQQLLLTGIDQEILEDCKNKTLSDSNLALCKPFIAENGQLCFTASIASFAGADSYQWIVNQNGIAWRKQCQEHS